MIKQQVYSGLYNRIKEELKYNTEKTNIYEHNTLNKYIMKNYIKNRLIETAIGKTGPFTVEMS